MGVHEMKTETIFNPETIEILAEVGETRIQFPMDSQEYLEKNWITTCDSDWGEGYSKVSLKASQTGNALFSGDLSIRIPQDGRVERSGYANMASVKKFYSFHRIKSLDWEHFTHFVMKVRGDGRKYNVDIHVQREFDIQWADLWSYPLHTRGGPYWQTVKIPFDKFLFSHRGKIQDNQLKLSHHSFDVERVAITLRDRTEGPFSLEVGPIGVLNDPNLKEVEDDEIAPHYEEYQFPYSHYDK